MDKKSYSAAFVVMIVLLIVAIALIGLAAFYVYGSGKSYDKSSIGIYQAPTDAYSDSYTRITYGMGDRTMHINDTGVYYGMQSVGKPTTNAYQYFSSGIACMNNCTENDMYEASLDMKSQGTYYYRAYYSDGKNVYWSDERKINVAYPMADDSQDDGYDPGDPDDPVSQED